VRYTRHIVAATVTVVTVGSLGSAILPGSDSSGLADGVYAHQYADSHAQEVSQARMRALGLADAINADHLRSAELHGADAAADDAVDALLGRP
jgi:hypothetical protein